jgi:uncharacterized protein (DUF433 family)
METDRDVLIGHVIARAVHEYTALMSAAAGIEVRPGVRGDKPVFVGTRITVYDVLEYLAAVMSGEQVIADFPELTQDHIRAALKFAADRERRLATPA